MKHMAAVSLLIFGIALLSPAPTMVSPYQATRSGANLTLRRDATGWYMDVNTASIPTKAVVQSGACDTVKPSSGASAYTYDAGPACTALLAYTAGMHFLFIPDVANVAGTASLNINQLGAKSIKQADGSTDPAPNALQSGHGIWLWYDGKVFRITG